MRVGGEVKEGEDDSARNPDRPTNILVDAPELEDEKSEMRTFKVNNCFFHIDLINHTSAQ